MTNENQNQNQNESEIDAESADEQPTHPPLAYDADGEPLHVPPHAVGWRVRKLARAAGRPKLIFDAETGRPLELELMVSLDDLADNVDESGRYRLEAIDANGRIIPRCVAVVHVQKDEEAAPFAAKLATDPAQVLPLMFQLLERVVNANATTMQAMASAFGHVERQSEPVVIHQQPPTEAKPSEEQKMKEMKDLLEMGGQLAGMFFGKKDTPAAVKGVPKPEGGGNA